MLVNFSFIDTPNGKYDLSLALPAVLHPHCLFFCVFLLLVRLDGKSLFSINYYWCYCLHCHIRFKPKNHFQFLWIISLILLKSEKSSLFVMALWISLVLIFLTYYFINLIVSKAIRCPNLQFTKKKQRLFLYIIRKNPCLDYFHWILLLLRTPVRVCVCVFAVYLLTEDYKRQFFRLFCCCCV